ncbi:MAG: hypothetical protein U1E37_09965 [Sphingomonadaceae bacterium]|jgi:hypothetical protein
MSMTSHVAVARISRELITSETDLDQAIASSAALLASMAKARIDTKTPVGDGQVAMMRLVKGLNSLTDARAEIVRTHGELRKIAEVRGDVLTPATDCPNGLVAEEVDELRRAS